MSIYYPNRHLARLGESQQESLTVFTTSSLLLVPYIVIFVPFFIYIFGLQRYFSPSVVSASRCRHPSPSPCSHLVITLLSLQILPSASPPLSTSPLSSSLVSYLPPLVSSFDLPLAQPSHLSLLMLPSLALSSPPSRFPLFTFFLLSFITSIDRLPHILCFPAVFLPVASSFSFALYLPAQDFFNYIILLRVSTCRCHPNFLFFFFGGRAWRGSLWCLFNYAYQEEEEKRRRHCGLMILVLFVSSFIFHGSSNLSTSTLHLTSQPEVVHSIPATLPSPSPPLSFINNSQITV